MKIWTIQPKWIYDKVLANGSFRCTDPASFADDDPNDRWKYEDAYDWMSEQMAKKIGKPSPNIYPIWGWYRYGDHNPGLNHWKFSGYGDDQEETVYLELEISSDQVVLSDFDDWHAVLNNQYLNPASNELEYDIFERQFNSYTRKVQERVKRQSWEDIFNLKNYDNEFRSRGQYIQATFWEITRDDIKKVKFFRSVNSGQKRIDAMVKEFVDRRWSTDCHWLGENSFWFSKILSDRFNGVIYYFPKTEQFTVRIGSGYYNWKGRVTELEFDRSSINQIKRKDPTFYNQILSKYRD